jgi:hypothetical protein
MADRPAGIRPTSLSGPSPELIVVRYPGVRRASADGQSCAVIGDLVHAPACRSMVIEF